MNHKLSALFLCCLSSQVLAESGARTVDLQDIEASYTRAPSEALTLKRAQSLLDQVSPQLLSNQAALEASQLDAKAAKRLGYPVVFARVSASAYRIQDDIDMTSIKPGIKTKINQLGIVTSPRIPVGTALAAGIPDTYELDRQDEQLKAGVGILWPIYTGGKISAMQDVLRAKSKESQADLAISNQSLYTLLVQRYFSVQLANQVQSLRQEALDTITQADQLTGRMFDEGFLSSIERMEASAALADAQFELVKANNMKTLANIGLNRLLRISGPVTPSTPLFMSTQPLDDLKHFQKLALANHPALDKVASKEAQAQSSRDMAVQRYKPTVSLFGYVDADERPSWTVGVSATWRFTGGMDPSASRASSQAKYRQAMYAGIELRDNLLLLVEKHWNDVANAQQAYKALQLKVDLSKKLVRMKRLGMKEGVSTSLDVVKAQTELYKASTQQAKAANDYVQALASLMQSAGTPMKFNDYMAKADIRFTPANQSNAL